MLPFTTDEFFAVFARYNATIWPTQIVAVVLGFVALILLFRSEPAASRVISLILTAFWLIMGIGYHLVFFAPINRMAYAFAVLFVAQAVLLFVDGVIRRQITYRAESGWRGWLAWALIVYALVIYPLIGLAGSLPYPMTPLCTSRRAPPRYSPSGCSSSATLGGACSLSRCCGVRLAVAPPSCWLCLRTTG